MKKKWSCKGKKKVCRQGNRLTSYNNQKQASKTEREKTYTKKKRKKEEKRETQREGRAGTWSLGGGLLSAAPAGTLFYLKTTESQAY